MKSLKKLKNVEKSRSKYNKCNLRKKGATGYTDSVLCGIGYTDYG